MANLDNSPTKAELKSVRALLTRSGRQEQKRFLAEGVRLLEEALRHGWTPLRVYAIRDLGAERARELIDRFRRLKIPVTPVSPSQLDALSDTATPQGIVAVFPLPSLSLETVALRRCHRVLWCVNVSDPGNLGTLIRSAVGFGVDMAVLSACTDPFGPKLLRGSAGAVFALPVCEASLAETLQWARQRKMAIVATALNGVADFGRLRRLARRPLVVAVGSEAHGLTREIIDTAALVLRIEHRDTIESLNAAVAGSIVLWELYGARRA